MSDKLDKLDKARDEKKPSKSKKSEKKNTSLRLEKKTLKALKIRAIEEDTSVQKLIERLIVEYLEKQDWSKTNQIQA